MLLNLEDFRLDRRFWRRAGALLCLLLLAALTTAAVAHVHHDSGLPGSDSSDQHCQLCQLSHSPAGIPTQAALLIYVALTAAAASVCHSLLRGRTAVRDVTIRPPPRLK